MFQQLLPLVFILFRAFHPSSGLEVGSTVSYAVQEEAPFEELTDIRFLYQCVDQHNEYRRANESSTLLIFNRGVENHARKRVTKMALTGKLLPYDSGSPYEENAAWTPAAGPVNCRDIVDHWFHEYRPSLPTASALKHDGTLTRKPPTGHSADFIWTRSTDLGCAQVLVHKPTQGVITVCNYYSSKSSKIKKLEPGHKPDSTWA